jgi:hypothetical protein
MKHFIYSCFLVLFVTSFLAAQTPIAKIKTEPVSEERLASLGLTTNSVSAGLPVFANQTYVYLSANDVGGFLPVLTSTFNLLQSPSGSTATLQDIGVANWRGLKADVTGIYRIELTITTTGGTDQDTISVYANNYVGVGNFDGVTASFPSCMSCHTGQAAFDNIYATWQNTGHANTLKKAMDQWSFFSTSCLKCHSTGTDYNLVAANNGFDDVAASLGWVWVGPPAPGKWAAFKAAYPGAVKFATIGCENCHGAGSTHPSTTPGAQFKTMATFEAGVCDQCHAESQGVQFELSLHAEALWSSSFAQSASSQNNNLQNCIRCHDAKGYINFTNGQTTNTTGMTRAMHISITCQTCHDPHGNNNPYSLRNSPAGSDTLGNGYSYAGVGGLGRLCMDCHKARRDNVTYQPTNISSHWGPHHSVQVDNFLGKNAYQFNATPYLSNSHQFAVTDACVTCHMSQLPDTSVTNPNKVGGHTFRLENPDTGYEYLGACTSCHGPKTSFDDFMAATDYDGDGSVESIPNEVEGLLRNIRILLPPTGVDSIAWQGIRASSDSVLFKRAYWNYQLIAYDGSYGMHNSKFAFDVLLKTQAALGTVVPVELVSFNAEIGKNGVTLSWETASELNNRGFEVERGIRGVWAVVGFVEGKGTTTEFTKYSFNDKPNTTDAVSYRLKQVDYNGQYTYSKVVNVDFGLMPTEFSLSQNYPNPFNPSTVIRYTVPFDSKVKVTVYNVSGEVVKVLVDGNVPAGQHEAMFTSSSAQGLASGIYLYNITATSNDGKSNFTQTKKMVLIK